MPVRIERGDNGRWIVPAPINAHDHGYGIRTLDFGAPDDALEPWIPHMRLRPRTDPYLEALVGFARLARQGVGATMHCHNSLNADRLVDEAQAVCRAAGDVGIRLGLSCPLLDFDAWAYDGGPQRLRAHMAPGDWEQVGAMAPRYRPIQEQIASVQAIVETCSSDMVNVQLGPIGPQWCSDQLLAAIAKLSAETGLRIHMHLLESPRQRRWLDRRFPQGVLSFLDEIGFLSPRLSVAHGVQLRPAEYGLMIERGVQLVSNPSANLRLRSGIAPVAAARRAGLAVAVGLDGTGLDDDQDWWRELRLFHLLHDGDGLQPETSAQQTLDQVFSAARQVLGLSGEDDTVELDGAALMADAMFDDLDPATVILTRATGQHVLAMRVAGQSVIEDGRLVRVDFQAARRELRQQALLDQPRLLAERDRVRILVEATRRYYADWGS
ncbi:MAG: amidohydrolase family protein [Alphaproteobacteria bacterium]|nr:amidohydrolase family protein [Alphaproteobacteria bacterium]